MLWGKKFLGINMNQSLKREVRQVMPSKKTVGWVVGTILVLGGGGYALAKYNTNSMAHVMYQRITHTADHSIQSAKSQQTHSDKQTTSTSSSTEVDTGAVRKLLTEKKFDGAYLVLEDGKMSKTKYVGSNQDQLKDKYFQIADLENAVTAAAVLKLVDQGKLKLSTPVSHYYDSLDVSSDVTVGDLLKMTSGLSNSSIPNNQLSNVLEWNVNHTNSDNSDNYDYQETNYVLLEGIISQVTNGSYQDYINQAILKPNHLNQVKFVPSINDNRLATPYNGKEEVDNPTLAKAMNEQMGKNQLMATPAGMMKLTQVLVKDYGDNKNFTASRNFTGQLMKDESKYYGSGGLVGYRTSVAISKDGKKGIVLMSNHSNGKDNMTGLVKESYDKLN